MANYKIVKNENGEKRLEKLEKVLHITLTLLDKELHQISYATRKATPDNKKAVIDKTKEAYKQEGFKVVDVLIEKAIKTTYVEIEKLDELDIFHD